jgi:hypothetical protein
MEKFNKQPGEKFPISVDFSSVLTDDSINTSSVKAFDESQRDVSADIIDGSPTVTNNNVIAVVKGGDSSKKYKISFEIVTNNGYIYQFDVLMQVREV